MRDESSTLQLPTFETTLPIILIEFSRQMFSFSEPISGVVSLFRVPIRAL